MASGKTTLGRKLAQMAGDIEFVDLDDYVEADSSMSIPEIFRQYGEAEFRRRETAALAELCARADGSRRLIIACGGGTPCHGRNMELMLSRGVPVWLQVSPERIVERLRIERSRRPLVANLPDDELHAFVVNALEQRQPFYSLTPHRFDASQLETDEQVSQSANRFISQFLTQS